MLHSISTTCTNDLCFWIGSEIGLSIYAMQVTLVYEDDDLIECLLDTMISSDIEQFIEEQELFNFKTDLCTSILNGHFLSDLDIHFKLSLRPDFFSDLPAKKTTPEAIASYLTRLSQQSSSYHPLLHHESWLCLSLKQHQEQGEVGYLTVWYYISPSSINASSNTSDPLLNNVMNVVTELAEGVLTEQLQTTVNQLFSGIIDTFVVDVNHSQPGTTDDTSPSLFATITEFFATTEWPFSLGSDQQSLRLLIRGKQGQWNGYAKVDEDNCTFVFYSICPIAASEDKRIAIAHFLTLANYGTIIGNFELDFNDGEIRYKTSIDVEDVRKACAEHSRLTPALIKRLVYTNVAMMDEYLPGIRAILEQRTTPEQAICLVEQGKPILTHESSAIAPTDL